MSSLYLLLPLALLLGLIGLASMIWAVKTGQFEDLEGPAHRILFDDDEKMMPNRDKKRVDPSDPSDPPKPKTDETKV